MEIGVDGGIDCVYCQPVLLAFLCDCGGEFANLCVEISPLLRQFKPDDGDRVDCAVLCFGRDFRLHVEHEAEFYCEVGCSGIVVLRCFYNSALGDTR